jgi:hypothetical protein
VVRAQAAVPAGTVYGLTSLVWRHVQEGRAAPGSFAQAPDVRRALDRIPDAGRARELRELVDRVDALDVTEQRLFTAAIDEIQVRSKLWLIDELTARHDIAGATLVVLGAWYGILPLLINWRLTAPPARMVCVDISADACALGEKVIGSRYPNIEYQVADAMRLDYRSLAHPPSSVLVNTICEHLADVPGWWLRVPAGQFTVLQSNNYDRCPDHINWVRDLDQMKAQTPLSKLLFEGTLRLPIFDRFMLIGHR